MPFTKFQEMSIASPPPPGTHKLKRQEKKKKKKKPAKQTTWYLPCRKANLPSKFKYGTGMHV